MEINVKESSMVCPAESSPKRSLWISNLDLVISPAYHIHTIYFYKSNGYCSDFFDSRVLKDALSKVLVPFYPVAGRLQYDQNGRIEIICNGEGVLFVEAETTTSAMDDLMGDYKDELNASRLVPSIDYSGGLSSYPLFALQVTRFKCGGVCVGVAVQHTLMDGPSALHFINSWAEMARGLPLTIHPFIDRTLLVSRVPPTPTFSHTEFLPSPYLKTSTESDANKQSILSVFSVTAEQLNSLKAKINENNKYFSTFCILTTHIWRCVTQARGLDYDQAVKLFMPVDGRSRLDPTLPVGYFGNVIFYATPVALVGDVLREPYLDTVKRIQDTLRKMDNGYLRSNIDYIDNVVDINSIMQGPHTMRCPNLSVNSWVRLPIYDADFGWGRPVYMRPANVFMEGKIFILPSPIKDGSLSIVTRLETSHTKSFEKMLYDF